MFWGIFFTWIYVPEIVLAILLEVFVWEMSLLTYVAIYAVWYSFYAKMQSPAKKSIIVLNEIVF